MRIAGVSRKVKMETKDADVERLEETAWERDFRNLRKQVEDKGLTKVNLFYYLKQLIGVIVLEALGFLVLYFFGSSLVPFIAAGLCFTLSQTQASWLQHDFGHASVFKSKSLNHLAEQFIYCHIKGLSTSLRNDIHMIHHDKPHYNINEPGKMDVGTFVLKLLLLPVELAWVNFEYMVQRRDVVEIVLALTFYGKLVYCLCPVLGGALGALGMFVFVRTLEIHMYLWLAPMSHNTSENANGHTEHWFIEQLNSSSNLESNSFIDWLTGSHSHEIEHHLFPSVPRHSLCLIAPLVQSMCKQHDLVYNQKSLMSAFAINIRALLSSRKAWIDSVRKEF